MQWSIKFHVPIREMGHFYIEIKKSGQFALLSESLQRILILSRKVCAVDPKR